MRNAKKGGFCSFRVILLFGSCFPFLKCLYNLKLKIVCFQVRTQSLFTVSRCASSRSLERLFVYETKLYRKQTYMLHQSIVKTNFIFCFWEVYVASFLSSFCCIIRSLQRHLKIVTHGFRFLNKISIINHIYSDCPDWPN